MNTCHTMTTSKAAARQHRYFYFKITRKCTSWVSTEQQNSTATPIKDSEIPRGGDTVVWPKSACFEFPGEYAVHWHSVFSFYFYLQHFVYCIMYHVPQLNMFCMLYYRQWQLHLRNSNCWARKNMTNRFPMWFTVIATIIPLFSNLH